MKTYSETAPFRSYKTDALESYRQGFVAGLQWTAAYAPSGPWVCSPGYDAEKGDIFWTYCKQTELNNKAWKLGWKDGLDRRRIALTEFGQYDMHATLTA